MKNKNIPQIKIGIQWELAYEIIQYSIITITLGLSFLFASNLLRFNWFTVLFLILAIILIYCKKENHLTINDHTLKINYWHFFLYKELKMDEIEEFIFYSDKRLLEVKHKDNEVVSCYLRKRQKEKLLSYLIRYFPEIPCLYIQQKNG